ncbi:MAG: class I tRNA ligase family protein, partial [Myxococcales bacterium]|nr:class I tRNA ligase family protein [Myxococcales bacterium]
ARMIMMGLKFMGDVPFRRVLLAGIVTDERGDKMSKVKGNVVDPLDVISGATLDALVQKAEAGGANEKARKYLTTSYPDGFAAYGADALRMTLLSYSPQSRRIALSLKRVEGYRNFANKLWNASRYALMKLEGSDVKATGHAPQPKHLVNRWILSRLDAALAGARTGIEDYRIDDASGALYHFVWDEFCDWYLELSKALLASDDEQLLDETRRTLVHTIEVTLRALHPMMPFITEEIWQRVPKHATAKASVLASAYPEPNADAVTDAEAEREMRALQAAIVGIRTIRAEHEITWQKMVPVLLRSDDPDVRALLARERNNVVALGNVTLTIESDGRDIPANSAVKVSDGVTVIVPLEGLVDKEKERERLSRELKRVEKDLTVVTGKLKNASFVERAPKEVVATERERQAELTDKREQLTRALEKLG